MESNKYIDNIFANIDRGLQGMNVGLPMGFPRFSEYVANIQQSTYHLIAGATGCVDGETEFFNGHHWEKIRNYIPGEKVLQYEKDGTARLVIPSDYIKKTVDYFYEISSRSGVEQRISKEHRIITVDKYDSTVIKETLADDFIKQHNKSVLGKLNKFITCFDYIPEEEYEIDDDILRHQVINLKEFPSIWYNLPKKSIHILINELGDFCNKENEGSFSGNYNTNLYNNACLLQFLFSRIGYKSRISTPKEAIRKYNVNYDAFNNPTLSNGKKLIRVEKDYNHDGYKYCFTVPSGMLVLRRNGVINITGNSGKTALVDSAYLMNPYNTIKTKGSIYELEIIYYSLEIDPEQKLTKLMANKLWRDYGIELSATEIMSKGNSKLNINDYEKLKEVRGYFEELTKNVHFRSTASPNFIYKDLLDHAEARGRLIRAPTNDGKPGTIIGYEPNKDNVITLVIIDHIGLVTPNAEDQGNLKKAIDRTSKILIMFRNIFRYSPIVVSQFNRSIENHDRMKSGNEPKLSDLKDSGGPSEDANVVIGLYYPFRYGKEEHLGYNIQILNRYYRSLHLLKNRDGPDNLVLGLLFMGKNGYFKELPKIDRIVSGEIPYRRIMNSINIEI